MAKAIEAAAGPPQQAGALRPALGAFALDVLMAVALVFGLSIAGTIAWAAVRAFQLGLDGGGSGPQQLAAQVGAPQGVALVLISVAATASAALLLYV